jgi:hypothetical protein
MSILGPSYMFSGKVGTSSPYGLIVCLDPMVGISRTSRVYRGSKNKTLVADEGSL